MAVVRDMSPYCLKLLYTEDIGGALFYRNVMSAGLNSTKSQRTVTFTATIVTGASQLFLIGFVFTSTFLSNFKHFMCCLYKETDSITRYFSHV
jgi:hypothetical protein